MQESGQLSDQKDCATNTSVTTLSWLSYFQATTNSLFFIMVGKRHALSPELMLFCFYDSDKTVREFRFCCSVISTNLKYLWKTSLGF